MFSKRLLPIVLVLLIGIIATPTTAQPPDTVVVSYPPPVFVLGGEAEIIGTADAPNQESYFVEYRPLGDDLQPRDGEDTPWLPATLPTRGTITDDVLGTWDTTTAPDGLYEIRLTVNRRTGGPLRALVSPIRVDNSTAEQFSPLDEDSAINNALLALTATAESGPSTAGSGAFATPIPGATRPATTSGASSDQITAQVVVVSNLRDGDSTLFGIRSALQPGTQLTVLGRSPRSSWFLVETARGERGWVAPSVVTLSGSILNVPPVDPPVPPITPTFTPTPVPPLPDAVVNSVRVDRDIIQGEAFQIIVAIANNGSQFLPESVLFCNVEPLNVNVSVTAGSLQPGTSTNVALPLRLDEGAGTDVTIICRIDMNEAIEEPNEDNNFGRTTVPVGS